MVISDINDDCIIFGDISKRCDFKLFCNPFCEPDNVAAFVGLIQKVVEYIEEFITKKERRPTTLKREGRIEQQKGRGALRGGCGGGEGRRRRRKGEKGGSIGKRNRRREGISRARAISAHC